MSVHSAEESVVTPLSAVRQQRLDAQLRVLEFNALLHRKLDLERLLEAFLSEGQAFVRFDSLQFTPRERGTEFVVGDTRHLRETFEMRLGEKVLGDLTLTRAKAFEAREVREAERLVECLVYPLDNALEHHQALMQAMTDESTGLQNQRALEALLPRELRLARRSRLALSALLLTVDRLDSISESYGTAVGEQAWHSVADALNGRLRASDLIFRTDDDAFLVLLSQTDLAGAEALADRLRRDVHRCVSFDNVQLVLSASVGVTELDVNDCPESFVERVGRALVEAQLAGRNRIHMLAAESPSGEVPGDDDPSVA